MSIRKIKYKGKTQSVKQWSIELNIPTRSIYKILKLGCPPKLVLNKDKFYFCYDYKAVLRAEKREGYAVELHLSKSAEPANSVCCNHNSICHFAIPITEWKDVSNDPYKANYYCKLQMDFVWGENPICK